VELGGDLIEAISMDDKRFHKHTTQTGREIISEQAEYVVSLLKPIRKKIICSLMGNHEYKLWRIIDFAEEIAKRLSVPYGTFTARITYADKHGVQFKHYATHGRKTINSTADDTQRRKTNMELILKRHLKFKSQTCMLASKGHTHKVLVCKPTPELYLDDQNGQLTQQYTTDIRHGQGYVHHDERWYCNTGSLMKLYEIGTSGYAEMSEYDPIELGFPVVKVRNRRIEDIDRVLL
jgi:hypothetical protein